MRGLHAYSKISQQTASPDRLMVMLFEATCRHLDAAAAHLDAADRKGALTPLTKAQDIVQELLSTLNPQVNAALCEQLAQVYTFTLSRLVRALSTGDAAAVREAQRVFSPVAQAFAQVVATKDNPGRAA